MNENELIRMPLLSQENGQAVYSDGRRILKMETGAEGGVPESVDLILLAPEQQRENPWPGADRRREAVITVTSGDLELIRRLAGEDRIAPAVIGDNGIAAFWSEGAELLRMLRETMELSDDSAAAEQDWETMTPQEKDSLLSIAAGCIDWAAETSLDHEYIEHCLAGDPELMSLVKRNAQPKQE